MPALRHRFSWYNGFSVLEEKALEYLGLKEYKDHVADVNLRTLLVLNFVLLGLVEKPLPGGFILLVGFTHLIDCF